jgi:O-antigen/teichoic acid export membrane protein
MSFIKDIISYSGSTTTTQIVGFLRGIIIRTLLIPEILGIYNVIQVIQGVVSVFDMGASAAASRELPILRGKNDVQSESLIRATVLWFTVGQSLVVGLGTILYAVFFDSEYSSLGIICFFIVAILLICSSVSTSYDIFLRSAQKYLSLSKIVFVMGLVEAGVYISGAYFGGINGLLIGVVSAAVIRLFVSVFIGYKNGITIKMKFSIPKLKKLLSFGFPLRLIDYPVRYMIIADLIWVAKFMDIGSLAIYTTAQLFFKQSNQIGNTFGTVFETRIIQHFGEHNSWERIAKIMKKYLYLQLLVVVPLLIWLCATFIPIIIRQFLPKYVEANDAIVYLMLGNFFIVTNSGLTIPWFIKKKLISRGISNSIGFVVMVSMLAFFWFILEKQELSSIAISVTLGYLSYFIYMIIFVGRELWSKKEIIITLSIVLLAAVWTALIIILGYSYTMPDLSFTSDLLRSMIIGLIMLLAISPVILMGLKISDFKQFIKMLN